MTKNELENAVIYFNGMRYYEWERIRNCIEEHFEQAKRNNALAVNKDIVDRNSIGLKLCKNDGEVSLIQ